MKIVLTGGGTGGHIYPAISIGQAIIKADPSAELLFIGSSHGPEGKLASEAGINFQAIPSSPLTKSISLRNFASLAKLIAGVFRARRMLKEFRPDVVIGTGGYTTAAVLMAQSSLRGKIIIHEQNAVPGRTNLWLAKIADKVCVSADGSAVFFPKNKVVITGMPVRDEFANLPKKIDARRILNLDENAFTILVVGGSQGAKKLNEVVTGAWPMMDDGNTQILHQTGERNIEDMRACNAVQSEKYHVAAYVDMPVAMASADLVISRSGASTIAEITAAGLGSILFPYPYAYAMHQKRNAEYLVQHGAAIICEDDAVSPQILAGIITDLRTSPEKLDSMASASAAMGKVDAADAVAKEAFSLAG